MADAYVPLTFGRSLPVRLEPRDRRDERRDDDHEGRAPSLPQPHDVCPRLSPRDAGDGVRRPPWNLHCATSQGVTSIFGDDRRRDLSTSAFVKSLLSIGATGIEPELSA